MPDSVKRVMGSRMFILGMSSLGCFVLGMVLIFLLLSDGKEATPLQAVMGQLAIVASVITGGASTVNVFKERADGS